MNIFLSWSGSLSHNVAQALAHWIPQVVQAVKPWLSSQDIDKGARWFEEIGTSLSKTDFGILCLTSTNILSPWILFEAGALSKSLDQSRVCPILINVTNTDLQGPLAQFNTAGVNRVEIYRLVETLNARLQAESKRTDIQLAQAFEVWWPHLENKLAEAVQLAKEEERHARTAPKRKVEDVLNELLDLTRRTAQLLGSAHDAPAPLVATEPGTLPIRKSITLVKKGSVGQFANRFGWSDEALLRLLTEAGIKKVSRNDPLTAGELDTFLDHLRKMRPDTPRT